MFVFLIFLWIFIVTALAVYLGRTPKGRGWLRILRRSKKLWAAILCLFVVVGLIAIAFYFQASPKPKKIEDRLLFSKYAANMVQQLAYPEEMTFDSSCKMDQVMPELAYILPSLLTIHKETVTEKRVVPRLSRLDNKLVLHLDGYKVFVNRGSKLLKRVKKDLGPRYKVSLTTQNANHTVTITYKGTLWDNEQLCGLPVLEAATKEGVDPSLLMALIRHTSDFRFDYTGPDRTRGLLALNRGTGLDQIFIGAQLLKKSLKENKTTEDAVASLYPIKRLRETSADWRKNPLRRTWVEQVIGDSRFYKNNGL